jgi:hypothetical protein
MAPHLLFFEPLSECITMGTLAAWAVFYLYRWDPVYFLLTHVLVWFLMDWSLLNVVQVARRRFANVKGNTDFSTLSRMDRSHLASSSSW